MLHTIEGPVSANVPELVVTERLSDLLRLLVQNLGNKLGGDNLSISHPGLVLCPLPHLTPGDFGGCSVFHEVMDGDTAVTREPGFHVCQTDFNVASDTLFCDSAFAAADVEQVRRGHINVLASHVELVGLVTIVA